MLWLEHSLLADHLILAIGLLFIASLIAGYIDSVAGGAGLILVPAALLAGFTPQAALGQEKLVSTVGTLAAIKNFMKSKSIIWKIVPLGIISSLIGAYIGTKTILLLPAEIVYYIILFFLPIGLVFTLLKGKIQKNNTLETLSFSMGIMIFTCFIVGFYDGFFGPGTGSIFIICLYLLNKIPLLNASATSKIFNFSSNIGSFVGFAMAGKMAFLVGIPMIAGSLIGNHIGSAHTIKTNGNVIKKVLIITVSLMLISLCIQLLW